MRCIGCDEVLSLGMGSFASLLASKAQSSPLGSDQDWMAQHYTILSTKFHHVAVSPLVNFSFHLICNVGMR